MAKHLRDCKAWKDEKLDLSTTNNDSAKLFDDVIHQYVTWAEDPQQGGIEGTLKKLLEGEPSFVMGNVLSVGLDLMGTGRSILLDDEFNSQVLNLENSMRSDQLLNEREKLHCKAVVEFAKGFYNDACNTWENILVNHPNDILAIKLAHDAYFYLGNSRMIRDSIGRVLPYWQPKETFYGYLKGMYSFGLEEMNMCSLAEKYAEEALALNPTDCWATHARAHCFEMKSQTQEGINFLKSTENDWSKGEMLACHNYWHWALYYIERGEYEEALGLYDQQVGKRCESGACLDLVDAASLLKRFELMDVDVGDRWNKVYDICRPHLDDHIMVFNDAHFLMSYLGASKKAEENTSDLFMKSIEDYVPRMNGTNYENFNKIGVNLFKGLVSFHEKEFDNAADYLYPLKNEIPIIGGSHAQRDVFDQLLIQSCIKSKNTSNIKRGFSLLHERKLLKENSPLTDRMMNRMLSCHGDLYN